MRSGENRLMAWADTRRPAATALARNHRHRQTPRKYRRSCMQKTAMNGAVENTAPAHRRGYAPKQPGRGRPETPDDRSQRTRPSGPPSSSPATDADVLQGQPGRFWATGDATTHRGRTPGPTPPRHPTRPPGTARSRTLRSPLGIGPLGHARCDAAIRPFSTDLLQPSPEPSEQASRYFVMARLTP